MTLCSNILGAPGAQGVSRSKPLHRSEGPGWAYSRLRSSSCRQWEAVNGLNQSVMCFPFYQITLEVGPKTLSLIKLYVSFIGIPVHILMSLLLKIFYYSCHENKIFTSIIFSKWLLEFWIDFFFWYTYSISSHLYEPSLLLPKNILVHSLKFSRMINTSSASNDNSIFQ